MLSGYLLFRDFCLKHLEEAKPLVEFYEEVGLRAGLALLCVGTGRAASLESRAPGVVPRHSAGPEVTCGDLVP